MGGESTFTGRVIKSGTATGEALVSLEPVSFLGGIDPDTGIVIEPNHPLLGQCVSGRIFCFPSGKGSTVGSYTIYRLARNGKAPAAILNAESEPIVAVGAIIAGIPMVDKIPLGSFKTGDRVRIEGERVVLQKGS